MSMANAGPSTESRPVQNRTLFRLAEAAVRVGRSTVDLLSAAADGFLELCVEVPAGAVLFCTASDVEYANYARFGGYGGPPEKLQASRPMDDVKYVFLSKDDCSKILSLGEFRQTVFQFGAKLNDANEVVSVAKPARDARSRTIGTVAALNVFRSCNRLARSTDVVFAKDLPAFPILLNEDLLLITVGELERYWSGMVQDVPPLLKVEKHTSDKLRTLYIAAQKWELALRKRSDGSPEDFARIHEEIVEFLRSKSCFRSRARLIRDAASLVRPIVARRENVRYGTHKSEVDVRGSPELRALQKASGLWAPYLQNPDLAPTNSEVQVALKKSLEGEPAAFIGLITRQGPAILRLEQAEDGRHKQAGKQKIKSRR